MRNRKSAALFLAPALAGQDGEPRGGKDDLGSRFVQAEAIGPQVPARTVSGNRRPTWTHSPPVCQLSDSRFEEAADLGRVLVREIFGVWRPRCVWYRTSSVDVQV